MPIKIINDLSKIITIEGNSDYSVFNIINNDYGVYIFMDKVSGKVYYIGEAKQQTLRDRIQQYFTKCNSGGTFRKNYMSKNDCDFSSYVSFIKKNKIIFITTSPSILISALEAILIHVLKPEYNIDK